MDDKELITLSSNKYLGLTTRPRLHAAVVVADYGVGSVRMIASTMTLHEQFEAMLAASKHVEATLTFQSGYATNLGVLHSLLTECDVVFSDELNHASIIDRVRLTEATRMIFPHKDLDTLETGLAEA